VGSSHGEGSRLLFDRYTQPVRLDYQSNQSASQQCFSLTKNQSAVLLTGQISPSEQADCFVANNGCGIKVSNQGEVKVLAC
jgi:hypothetical protein